MKELIMPTGVRFGAPANSCARISAVVKPGGVTDIALGRVHEARGDATDIFALIVAMAQEAL